MHKAGIRLLVGPDQLPLLSDAVPPLAYAVDNGAWGAHTRGQNFDAVAFREVLRRWGSWSDWIVLPDIVAGGLDSLALSLSWLTEVRRYSLPLLAVQDGMTEADVVEHVGPAYGIFVGGSTTWKWTTAARWGDLAKARGAYLHVGRVNSMEAIAAAIGAGANSVDGTSPSRFSVNSPLLERGAIADGQPPLPLFTTG